MQLSTAGKELKTPILFLIFNRLDVTKLVFEQIKLAQPTRLYIACDGPRDSKIDENRVVTEIREWIIENITWDCQYFTLFREKNLGCGKAVSSAIDWFFENEPEGIVLEDDCLPNQDFFYFCEEMLDRYRDNDKIAHICGCNLQDGIIRSEDSYYFSNFTYVWGWAGWRRVWQQYDYNLNQLDNAKKKDFLNELTKSKMYKLFLNYIFKNVKKGRIDTWDFQYLFLNVFNNSLAIVPCNNMISNIGFNDDATHTTGDSVNALLPLQALTLPIKHPAEMSANHEADGYTLGKISPKPTGIIVPVIKTYVKELLEINRLTIAKKRNG